MSIVDRRYNYFERRCEDLANGLDMLEKENIENRTELVKFGYFIAGISSDRAKWIKEGGEPKYYVPSVEFWDNFFYYLHLNTENEKSKKSNIVPGQSAQGI